MKRAIIYARVSTDDQKDKGYSLPTQVEQCHNYAERLGYQVVVEFKDDYSGATAIAERPEGKKMVAMLKRCEADAVIVYQVDRLSRDIVNLLASVQMWLRAGVEIHSCDMGKVESELDIVLVIKGWQGSDERKKIVERTSRGRRAKAQSGKVVGVNRAPYGYRFVRDIDNRVVGMEIDEQRACIVRQIFNLYVRPISPLSIRNVARELNARLVPPPGGANYRSLQGVWEYTTVATILSNETYVGCWRYGKHRNNRRTELSEQICVPVPALIDQDTFDFAQVRRDYNRQMSKRNTKLNYLLRGLVTCGTCGRSMYGAATGYHRERGKVADDESRRYICSGKYLLKGDCRANSTRAKILEAQIWADIKGLLDDLDGLWDKLKKAQAEELEQHEPIREELDAVLVNLGHASGEAVQIADTLPHMTGAVRKAMEEKAKEVNARCEALEARTKELENALTSRRLTDEAIGDIFTYARDAKEGIAHATESDKRRYLETLCVKVKMVSIAEKACYHVLCLLGEWDGELVKDRIVFNISQF